VESMLVLISANAVASLLAGGEWAGWCCTYAPTGKLKPVPEQFLSDTAIEWGQVPNGFEELTTETLSGAADAINRRTVRILPEDGCMVENVGVNVHRSTLPLAAPAVPPAVAIDTRTGKEDAWRIETIFDGLGSYPSEKKGAKAASALRTRIVFFFEPHSGKMSPVGASAWQERRWDKEAGALSVNEDASRSGLDGAWISTAVGVECFGTDDGRMIGSTLYLPSIGVSVLLEEEAIAVAFEKADGQIVTVQRIFDHGECSSRLIAAPSPPPDTIPKLQID